MSSVVIDMEILKNRVELVSQNGRLGLKRRDTACVVWAANELEGVVRAAARAQSMFLGGLRDAMFVQYAAFHLFNLGRLSRALDYDSVLALAAPSFRPDVVSFISTKLCNFRCPHCYNDSGNRHHAELASEQKEALISYLGRWGVPKVALSGGEPTIDPDLPRILAVARQYRISVKLTTNAWAIPDCILEGVRDGTISQVNVSLDGADELTHDSFRKKSGSFARVMKSLSVLRDSKLPSLVINACIHSGLIHQMEPLALLARYFGCSAISFKAVVSTGRRECSSDNFILSDTQLGGFEVERERLKASMGEALAIDGKLITEEVPSNLLDAVSCNAGSESMMIDADGTMLPCEVISSVVTGPNFLEITPSQAWLQDNVFLQFREAKVVHRGGCGTNGCPGCSMKKRQVPRHLDS